MCFLFLYLLDFSSVFCYQVMKKLKNLVVAQKVAKDRMDEFAAPTKKIQKKQSGPGPLAGKVVRIVDESSHPCGHLIDVKSHEGSKLMGQPVFKAYLKEFIPQAEKAPHQICCDEKDVIDMTKVEKPEAKCAKALKFTVEERAEIEMKFNPDELREFSGFDKDPRFAAVHMNMWWYLLSRDFDLSKDSGIHWLRSESISQICHELDQEMAGESFTRVVGTFAAELKDAKHVFIPVWGGSYGGGDQHWTWLYLEKKDDVKWMAEYRDSLQSLHKDCWNNADKIITIMNVALNDYVLKMPKTRANGKMQPKGFPLCGQFVCHWTDSKVRQIFGEGSHSIGHPHIVRINTRILKMQSIIIANKGFAKIHADKLARIQQKMQQDKEKEEMACNK